MLMKGLKSLVVFAALLPVAAFGSMVYVPSRPCNNTAWVPAYQNLPCGCQQNGWSYNCDGAEAQDVQTYDFEQNVPQQQVAQQYDVNQEPKPKAEDKAFAVVGWYLAANVMMNMWSWENEYKSNYDGVNLAFEDDKYSFKRVLSGSVALGTMFDKELRGDIEFGLSKQFKDENEFATYTMSAPYIMANFYRDFESGLYFGAGVGVARPEAKLELRLPAGVSRSAKKAWTPRVSAMLGYALGFGDNMYLDLKYRLTGFKGTKMSGTFLWDQDETDEYIEVYSLNVEAGLVVENTLSVGLRYRF